jgi:hypothetical protein
VGQLLAGISAPQLVASTLAEACVSRFGASQAPNVTATQLGQDAAGRRRLAAADAPPAGLHVSAVFSAVDGAAAAALAAALLAQLGSVVPGDWVGEVDVTEVMLNGSPFTLPQPKEFPLALVLGAAGGALALLLGALGGCVGGGGGDGWAGRGGHGAQPQAWTAAPLGSPMTHPLFNALPPRPRCRSRAAAGVAAPPSAAPGGRQRGALRRPV